MKRNVKVIELATQRYFIYEYFINHISSNYNSKDRN